jgi:heme exporter protein D
MAVFGKTDQRSQKLFAYGRRFFRWLTTPHVFLSLIMLVIHVLHGHHSTVSHGHDNHPRAGY